MKRFFKAITCTVMAAAMLFAVGACTEWVPEGGGPTKTTGQGLAIGEGNGGCIAEVIVAIDGYGNPIKVQFDEIFSPNDAGSTAKANEEGVANYNPKAAPTIAVAGSWGMTSYYFQYIKIGDKYFKFDATDKVYKQIGGDGAITNLNEYALGDGMQWYYERIINKGAYACRKPAADEPTAGEEVGEIKLMTAGNLTSQYGSLRKRYSSYWNIQSGLSGSQLGFTGNMDMLESYLITYGFGDVDKITNPGASSSFVIINGITTGATLSNGTANYLSVAKAAYDNALANQKPL